MLLTTVSVCTLSLKCHQQGHAYICQGVFSIATLLIIIDGIVLKVTNNVLCLCQKFMVGLNFANEQEAERFGNAVETKINERMEKKRANSEHLVPTLLRNLCIILRLCLSSQAWRWRSP